MRIGFWKSSKEKFFISHNKGLNDEQVKELQGLKIGDRLCLWANDLDGNSPNYSLKKFVEREPDATS